MSAYRVILSAVLGVVLAALAAPPAEAQVRIVIEGRWDWGSDEPRYRDDHGYYYPTLPSNSIRVPPGHLPRPGYCRVWYPGRPPGHQPRPVRCSSLRYVYPGAVVIGAAGVPWAPYYGYDGYAYDRRYGDNRYPDYWEYDDWWDRDRKPKKSRGRGRR